jgi:esterase/lipase superfamily enzyme
VTSTFVGRLASPASKRLLAVVAFALVGGCATTHPLMPTPALYRGAEATPLFTKVPSSRQTSAIDLLYITDRAPRVNSDDDQPYTAERARSLSFGSVSVDIGEGVSWDRLARESTAGERPVPLDLKLGPTHELGRFPPVIYGLVRTADGVTRDSAEMDVHDKAMAEFKAELGRRLAQSPRKEVVLFVHGYHETFSDAAFTMAELCHFLGREDVCAIFTWPAGGKRGLLFGYNVDRESSEYAVEHLKKTIRMIADTPGVERIHLLAHSRGTDVLASAVSLLNVEAYVRQTTLPRRFKIANVVLMAPDLDFDVAATKIFNVISDPELPYGSAPNPRGVFPTPDLRVTIYVSPQDKALSVSEFLFGSLMRLGRLQASAIRKEDIDRARKAGFFDVISVTGTTDMFGHSYFTSNPDVSSDLIALIRYGAKPGDALRPLVEVDRPFWRVRAPGDSPQK